MKGLMLVIVAALPLAAAGCAGNTVVKNETMSAPQTRWSMQPAVLAEAYEATMGEYHACRDSACRSAAIRKLGTLVNAAGDDDIKNRLLIELCSAAAFDGDPIAVRFGCLDSEPLRGLMATREERR